MEKILKNKKVVIGAIVLIILIIIISMSSSSNKSTPINDPLAMIDLSMKIESDVGLQDVMITEVTGSIIEIRAKTPFTSTKEYLANDAAYVFGYVKPFINSGIKKVRVIYTINGLDATLFEASLSDITDWVNKKIDDTAFAKKIKVSTLPTK